VDLRNNTRNEFDIKNRMAMKADHHGMRHLSAIPHHGSFSLNPGEYEAYPQCLSKPNHFSETCPNRAASPESQTRDSMKVDHACQISTIITAIFLDFYQRNPGVM
jgi:hypothetical protein